MVVGRSRRSGTIWISGSVLHRSTSVHVGHVHCPGGSSRARLLVVLRPQRRRAPHLGVESLPNECRRRHRRRCDRPDRPRGTESAAFRCSTSVGLHVVLGVDSRGGGLPLLGSEPDLEPSRRPPAEHAQPGSPFIHSCRAPGHHRDCFRVRMGGGDVASIVGNDVRLPRSVVTGVGAIVTRRRSPEPPGLVDRTHGRPRHGTPGELAGGVDRCGEPSRSPIRRGAHGIRFDSPRDRIGGVPMGLPGRFNTSGHQQEAHVESGLGSSGQRTVHGPSVRAR